MSRKLATIRRIAEIKSIEGADRIVAYRVDGWWVIGQKDQFNIDDLVLYLEIDSWVPTKLAPFLSRGKEPREFKGIKGEKLKTIRMKGQISQGLILPLVKEGTFWGYQETTPAGRTLLIVVDEYEDLTETLGIMVWEAPTKYDSRGNYIGNPEAREGGFPWYIPKTDQERIQNCSKQLSRWIQNREEFEVTEKLHGSSMTVYVNDQDEGVCSRNINLKVPENGVFNPYWLVAQSNELIPKLRSTGRNLAIQGELIGPGVHGNMYNLDKIDFYLFNIWDIIHQRWFSSEERVQLCELLNIKHVPILPVFKVTPETTIDSLLSSADGNSILNPNAFREGLVFKSLKSSESFKAVSNYFLERE